MIKLLIQWDNRWGNRGEEFTICHEDYLITELEEKIKISSKEPVKVWLVEEILGMKKTFLKKMVEVDMEKTIKRVYEKVRLKNEIDKKFRQKFI